MDAAHTRLAALRETAVVLLAGSVLLFFWNYAIGPVGSGPCDLYPTYIAAKMWLGGHVDAVYHPQVFVAPNQLHPLWQEFAKSNQLGLSNTSFVYAPSYLLLVAPLVKVLSLFQFSWAFACANACSAAYIGNESLRLGGFRSLSVRALGGIALGMSFPFLDSAGLGQNTAVAMVLCMLGFRLLDSPRRAIRWTAIALIILSTTFKPWFVLVVGIPLLQKQWRLFSVLLGICVLVNMLLPILIFDGEILSSYVQMLRTLSRVSTVVYFDQSLRAFLQRIADPNATSMLFRCCGDRQAQGSLLLIELLFMVLLATAVVSFCWRRAQRLDGAAVLLSGMALSIAPLGICWIHYFVMAMPLVLFVLVNKYQSRHAKFVAAILLFWLVGISSHHAPKITSFHVADALLLHMPYFLTLALSLLVIRTGTTT